MARKLFTLSNLDGVSYDISLDVLDGYTWALAAKTLHALGVAAVYLTGTPVSGNSIQRLSLVDLASGQELVSHQQVASTAPVVVTGTLNDDTLGSTAATDRQWLVGGAGNDTLQGGLGVDILMGGAGNDTLVGAGERTDIALFSGNQADYTISASAAGILVVGKNGAAVEGTDHLSNVNLLQFADGKQFVLAAAERVAVSGLEPDHAVAVNSSKLYNGTKAAESFVVADNLSAMILAGAGDTVQFSGNLSDYTYTARGSQLQISRGAYMTTVNLGGVIKIKTASHEVEASLSFSPTGPAMTLGLQTVSTGRFDLAQIADLTPPTVPTIVPSINVSVPVVSGIAEANSTVTVYDGANLLGSTQANASGVYSYALSPASSASRSITTTATDAAGNTSAASGLVTLKTDGLLMQDLHAGTGNAASNGKLVVVDYTGTLANGTVFDSSIPRNQPFAFQLGAGKVIAGWEEGLLGMATGSERLLVIPSVLGYGTSAVGSIPANSNLTFDVKLINVFDPASALANWYAFHGGTLSFSDASAMLFGGYLSTGTYRYATSQSYGNNLDMVGKTGLQMGLALSSGDANLKASSTANCFLFGGSGHSTLTGVGSNSQFLFGGSGTNTLMGAAGDDWLEGGMGASSLTGGLGSDIIMIDSGAATVHLQSLADSKLTQPYSYVDSTTKQTVNTVVPGWDRIVNFTIGKDSIDAPTAIAAGAIKDLGTVTSWSEAGIQELLSAQNFPALSGALVKFVDTGGYRHDFLVLNDAQAGYQAATDGIVEITGYTGSFANLAVL